MKTKKNSSRHETRDELVTRLGQELDHDDLADEQNPEFLFSMTATDLLHAIANDLIDAKALARQTLGYRGIAPNGEQTTAREALTRWRKVNVDEADQAGFEERCRIEDILNG